MQALTFFFAFVAVLALIGFAAWLVRRFATNRLGANTNRGRMPRLAVIDAAAVDGRRRLVLVRRDNIEHLIMIGGPTDIVVESNIVRAQAGRDQLPQRPGASQPSCRPGFAPLPDAGWTDGEGREGVGRLRSSRAADARAAAASGAAFLCRGSPLARRRRLCCRSAAASLARRALAQRCLAQRALAAVHGRSSAAVRSRGPNRVPNRCRRASPAPSR